MIIVMQSKRFGRTAETIAVQDKHLLLGSG